VSEADPKRPKRAGRRGGAAPKPRRLRATSLSASVVLHTVLIAGAVLSGLFLTRSEAPRRLFEVKYDGRDMGASLPEEEPEELAQVDPVEVPLSEEPELLPEPVHPNVDPDALRDEEPLDVTMFRELPRALSSETVFGFTPEVASDPEDPAASELEDPAAHEPEDPAAQEPEDQQETNTAEEPAAEASEPAGIPEVSPDEPLHLTRVEGTDPSYPKLSLRKREEGDVVLRLRVDAEGRVTLVELAETSGIRRLDQAAMSAAPTWRFSVPAAGPPESFEHTVHFRLERR